MKRYVTVIILVSIMVAIAGYQAAAVPKYKIAWSHYTGWEPWQLANHTGILKKWADKYGIDIELVLVNDYVESINLFTAGSFQGCTMTNMDALTIPASGGVDSTALIVGDFSNGNDGIVMRNGSTVQDLKGREVKLVQLSVSHYLLARALEINDMKEQDMTLINTSDADIAAVFAADPNGAAVTWNPPLMQCRNVKGAELVFDSSKIPGEIIDLMVVRSDAPESLKKALTAAWYETMQLMSSKAKEGKEAIQYMAQFAGGTEAEFRAQLATTKMFYLPAESAEFAKGEQLKKTMDYVRTFCFTHDLYPKGANSKDYVGIRFPDGSVMGDETNVKLRFDSRYMEMAAAGKL
ncbi:MAG: putative urea ABC transporter substrate-binding protein [Desulfomonilaceae bacterium]|nr:putative urea ABC transporter substrate-binding protein [Desulfomonilaceae bacterium]